MATVHEDAVLKQYYPEVRAMVGAPGLDAIVRGTVTKVAYESTEDVAMTVLTVAVSRRILGAAPPTITVREDGGYLPASVMIADLKDKDPGVKPAIDPDGVVDVRFEGADHLRRGDQVILFLTRDPNEGRETGYLEFGSVYGRFKLNGEESFRRAGTDREMAADVTVDELQKVVASSR